MGEEGCRARGFGGAWVWEGGCLEGFLAWVGSGSWKCTMGNWWHSREAQPWREAREES